MVQGKMATDRTPDDRTARGLMPRDPMARDPMARDPMADDPMATGRTTDAPTARDLMVSVLHHHDRPTNRIVNEAVSLTMLAAVPRRSGRTRSSIAWTRITTVICLATSSKRSPSCIAGRVRLADPMRLADPAARRWLTAVPTCEAAVRRGLAVIAATFLVRNDSKADRLGRARATDRKPTADSVVHRGHIQRSALKARATEARPKDRLITMANPATTIRATISDRPRGNQTLGIAAM